MIKNTLQFGQSLIEILFAIAIFTIGVFTIGYLVIDTQMSLQRNIEFTQARLLAFEGIEVVHLLRNNDFTSIPTGTHGLALSGAMWSLTPGEPDNTGKFVRSITIEDMSPKVKKVTSHVAWGGFNQVERTVSFTSYVTNWTQDSSDADALTVLTDNVLLSPSGSQVTGLTIENTGLNEITVESVVGEWTSTSTLTQMVIDGVEVFSISTSSPTGLSSGSLIDIIDVSLLDGMGQKDIDSITFDGSLLNDTLVLTFMLSDESSREVTLNL